MLLQKIKDICSIRKVPFACLYIYISAVLIGTYIADISINCRTLIIPILLLGAMYFALFLYHLCEYALIAGKGEEHISKEECKFSFLFAFVVVFCSFLVYYFAFFPGAFAPDSNSQLNQAVSGVYSDWHPFIHTFLFFTIPMKVFGAEEMIVLLQFLYFSFGFAYLIMTIRKYGCPRRISVAVVFLVAFAPASGNIMMYPLKDCGLSIFSTIATAHYINIILTEAEWLKKKKNLFVCSFFWTLTTLVRHNAILLTFPMIVSTLWTGWKNRKQVVYTIILFLAMLLFTRGFLYQIYHVEKPGDRILETTGMCMTVMGNVVKNQPDSLDKETLDFLYRVSPKEVWQESYQTGSFNSIKWNSETNTDVIEEEGLQNILKYTWKAFNASEKYAFQAFLSLTGMVWKVDGNKVGDVHAFADVDKTDLALNADMQEKAVILLRNWENFVNKSILNYPMNYIGWYNLMLFSFSLIMIKKRCDLRKAFIGTPLLCYNFGTALLLTGFDWRFFYLTLPIAIPMIFLVVKVGRKNN